MTIEDIQALIHGDETRTLEMKKTTGELKDGIRSVCAFIQPERIVCMGYIQKKRHTAWPKGTLARARTVQPCNPHNPTS